MLSANLGSSFKVRVSKYYNFVGADQKINKIFKKEMTMDNQNNIRSSNSVPICSPVK